MIRPTLLSIFLSVTASAGLGLLLFTLVLPFLCSLFAPPPDVQTGLTGAGLGLTLTVISLAILHFYSAGIMNFLMPWRFNHLLIGLNQILLSLGMGALCFNLVVLIRYERLFSNIVGFCAVLLILAAIGKAGYYFHWARQRPSSSQRNALADYAEIMFYLRISVFVLSFILPLGFGFFVLETGSLLAALLTVLVAGVGLLIERWLFFVEMAARPSSNQ